MVQVRGSGSSDLIWVWALAMSGCLCVGASLSLSLSPLSFGDKRLMNMLRVKLGMFVLYTFSWICIRKNIFICIGNMKKAY